MNEDTGHRGRPRSRPSKPSDSRSSRPARSGAIPPETESQQSPSTPALMENIKTLNMENPQNIMNVPTSITGEGGVALNIHISGNRGGQRNTETLPDEVVFYNCPRADHEIYYGQLLTKKRGSPLFEPGPGRRLPIEYRKQGIGLGDVGIVTHLGKFDFLFNIFQPADSPVNRRGVPPSFSPINEQDLDIDEGNPYGCNTFLTSSSVICTSGINSSDLRFESTAQEAAILTMPEGGVTRDLLSKNVIRSCIAENARSWYEYITGPRGRIIERGEILGVVVGWDKVSSWGIATSTGTSGQAVLLEFKVNNESSTSQTYRWECTQAGSASVRVGPLEAEISDLRQENDPPPENQSVFIRTINFTSKGVVLDNFPTTAVQSDIPVSGTGKPQDSPTTHHGSRGRSRGQHSSRGRSTYSGRRGSHSYQAVTSNRTEPGIVHPSSWLHEQLLERHPNATLVITEDADWMSVLTDEDTVFPEPKELLSRILASHDVCENAGTVTVQRRSEFEILRTRLLDEVLQGEDSSAPRLDISNLLALSPSSPPIMRNIEIVHMAEPAGSVALNVNDHREQLENRETALLSNNESYSRPVRQALSHMLAPSQSFSSPSTTRNIGTVTQTQHIMHAPTGTSHAVAVNIKTSNEHREESKSKETELLSNIESYSKPPIRRARSRVLAPSRRNIGTVNMSQPQHTIISHRQGHRALVNINTLNASEHREESKTGLPSNIEAYSKRALPEPSPSSSSFIGDIESVNMTKPQSMTMNAPTTGPRSISVNVNTSDDHPSRTEVSEKRPVEPEL